MWEPQRWAGASAWEAPAVPSSVGLVPGASTVQRFRPLTLSLGHVTSGLGLLICAVETVLVTSTPDCWRAEGVMGTKHSAWCLADHRPRVLGTISHCCNYHAAAAEGTASETDSGRPLAPSHMDRGLEQARRPASGSFSHLPLGMLLL